MVTIDELKKIAKNYIENGFSEKAKEQSALVLHIIDENESYEKKIVELKINISSLKQENENLKCCGNCRSSNDIDVGGYFEFTCNKRNKPEGGFRYCHSWEYDELSQEDRHL